jgi:hypothetical protein
MTQVLNENWAYDCGMSAEELGRRALFCFDYDHVYEIDVSNWDGSLIPEMLDLEIWFVENCAPALPDRWDEIKRNWHNTTVKGEKGMFFKSNHGRKSGDNWTSQFNSLLNLCIASFVFGMDTFCTAKGDDGFLGTNSDITVPQIVEAYAELGMTVKVKEVDHVANLGYCSGTFWPVHGDKWKWGVNPFRVLSKLGMNLHRHSKKTHKRLLLGTAISLQPIASHVPFIGPLIDQIVVSGAHNHIVPIEAIHEEWQTTSLNVDPVHDWSYHVVMRKYRLEPSDVLEMEYQCRHNVDTGLPLSINDFPLELCDSRFFLAFQRETDCEAEYPSYKVDDPSVVQEQHKDYVEAVKEQPTYSIFFAPVIEECFRCLLLPWILSYFVPFVQLRWFVATLVIVGLEIWQRGDSQYVAVSFHMFQWCLLVASNSVFLLTMTHHFYNVYVFIVEGFATTLVLNFKRYRTTRHGYSQHTYRYLRAMLQIAGPRR